MIRKDGFYINHKTGTSQYGQPFELTTILIFTKNDLVYINEEYGIIEPSEYNKDILEMDFGTELSSTLGRYSTNKNLIKISFPLGNISNIDREYKELIGLFSENKLILDYNICNWSEKMQDYYKRTLIKDFEFKFYSLSENKYIEESIKDSQNLFERKTTVNTQANFYKSNLDKKNDRGRNSTIGCVFGVFGAIIGAIFGGISGFFIGLVVGVFVGFILKYLID